MRRLFAYRSDRRNAWKRYYRKTGIDWKNFMVMLIQLEEKRLLELRKQKVKTLSELDVRRKLYV